MGLAAGDRPAPPSSLNSHPLFNGFASFLRDQGYNGHLFVMGRSLGSAAAIEVAYHYQQKLKGLIVESGFSSQETLLARLGASHLFEHPDKVVGFANDIKIKAIRIPTLIIHGERDEIIPVAEGRIFPSPFPALPRRGPSLFQAPAITTSLSMPSTST